MAPPGRPEDRAKEIAARTVTRRRREKGRTPRKTSQGTGNPNPSRGRTRRELYNLTAARHIAGRSKLDKAGSSGFFAAARRRRRPPQRDQPAACAFS
jgi:hypothetical protein